MIWFGSFLARRSHVVLFFGRQTLRKPTEHVGGAERTPPRYITRDADVAGNFCGTGCLPGRRHVPLVAPGSLSHTSMS